MNETCLRVHSTGPGNAGPVADIGPSLNIEFV